RRADRQPQQVRVQQMTRRASGREGDGAAARRPHGPTLAKTSEYPPMTRALPALALALALPALAAADPLTITVTGGKTDETNVVCTAKLPAGNPANPTCLIWLDKTAIPTQRVNPGLLDPQDGSQYLVFVLPKLKAGETATLTPGDDITGTAPAF